MDDVHLFRAQSLNPFEQLIDDLCSRRVGIAFRMLQSYDEINKKGFNTHFLSSLL